MFDMTKYTAMIGTTRTDSRGLAWKVEKATYSQATKNTPAMVTLSGRVTEHKKAEWTPNGTTFGAYAFETIYVLTDAQAPTSVDHNSNNDAPEGTMNATELAKMTVKALNVKARELGMKRYSRLRKAELIAAIVDFTMPVEFLSVEEPADHDAISDIMSAVVAEAEAITEAATVAPVVFSEAMVKPVRMVCCGNRYATIAETHNHMCPAKAPQVAVEATTEEPEGYETNDDILTFIRNMRPALYAATGDRQTRYATIVKGKLAILRARNFDAKFLRNLVTV